MSNVSQELKKEHIKEILGGKRILVTGGTGSFGHQIVELLLPYEPKFIVVFSRDEAKQYFMREEFRNDPRLEFFIGDVREYSSVRSSMEGVDYVYHAAALKQVPSCEFFPSEAIRTNCLGAENVRRAAIDANVKAVVSVSTDKAVKPVNAMGMSKALMEKIMLNTQAETRDTKFMCVRYGNVVGSRGSVVPLFLERIKNNRPLPITVADMTRFLLTLPQAIDLVLRATLLGESGMLYVKKMPACTISLLARTLAKALTGSYNYPQEQVGIRPGEKIHEVLVSEEEMRRAVESNDHYAILPPGRAIESKLLRSLVEYRSDNTDQLDEAALLQLLEHAGLVTK